MKRVPVLVFLTILFLASWVGADTKLITQVEGYAVLATSSTQDPSLVCFGLGKLDLRSQGAENTRGQLTLNISYSEGIFLDISRAYVKYSLPEVRWTLGKTLASWGEGMVFNAGDLLFPDFDPSGTLSAESVKDKSLWLAGLNVPLGDLSFFEILGGAPGINLLTPGPLPPWFEGALGGRGYFDMEVLALQLGYLYSGEGKEHRSFLGFNTAWDTFNFYGNAASSLPSNLFVHPSPTQVLLDSFSFSLGFFQSLTTGWERRFSYRFEAQGKSSALVSSANIYGELSLELEDTQNLTLRMVYHQEDQSAVGTLLYTWQLDKGFWILVIPSIQLGEPGDKYSWNKVGGMNLTAGFRFVF